MPQAENGYFTVCVYMYVYACVYVCVCICTYICMKELSFAHSRSTDFKHNDKNHGSWQRSVSIRHRASHTIHLWHRVTHSNCEPPRGAKPLPHPERPAIRPAPRPRPKRSLQGGSGLSGDWSRPAPGDAAAKPHCGAVDGRTARAHGAPA